jgi:hypothetical protein
MAESPSHRFGQIIGEVLEAAIEPVLADFAQEHHLFLDKKGPRPCRSGKKCKWKDMYGNSHDLDFVLERGGSLQEVGMPAAFIEVAWRSYTKHSRNKAQEIQGAIVPLAETYRTAGPFKGAVLAGVFTADALKQLRSLGFIVLYFPRAAVAKVFRKFGIDATFDEDTPDAELKKKVEAYGRLSAKSRAQLRRELLYENASGLAVFMKSLRNAAIRKVKRIVILPLHGGAHEVASIHDAVKFIEEYERDAKWVPFVRYEIQMTYNNGDEIRGEFKDKSSAVDFLQTFLP